MTPPNPHHASLPSLRKELVRSITLISALWLTAVFLTMAYVVRDEVNELMDNALQESAEVIYGILVIHGSHLPLQSSHSLPAPAHEERLVWQIVDASQQVVLRSHKAPDTPLISSFAPGLSHTPGLWRVYAMQLPPIPSGNRQVLYVGQRITERVESRVEAIATVGAAGLLAGLVGAVWMRRRVLVALRPLGTLSAQIKHYDPMDPATQLPAPTRQEFVNVQAAITDLGSRLARRVESEQAFAAHAAHALRTPLAGMDAQLAVALKEASDAARPRLQRTRDAVVRLKRVVTSLLALFRSGAALDIQAINLPDLVLRLPIEGLIIHATQTGTLRADPNLLAAALVNLLENAVRYGAKNCWVTCQDDGTHPCITLQDDGPGLPPQACAELQTHVDQPAEGGFVGLGLKLAALVARAHHGQLVIGRRAEDPPPQAQGFTVTLVLGVPG
jgi:signal transduction histidine kinase